MGAVAAYAVGARSASPLAVVGKVAGADVAGETGTVTIEMSTSVDELDLTTDLGAAFQATGGHTMYGGGVYFDSDQYLWTSVNGVGIDPSDDGDIFSPFHTSKESGTGLGLAITRKVVEGHGGTVELDRGVTDGAAIVVTLPRAGGAA